MEGLKVVMIGGGRERLPFVGIIKWWSVSMDSTSASTLPTAESSSIVVVHDEQVETSKARLTDATACCKSSRSRSIEVWFLFSDSIRSHKYRGSNRSAYSEPRMTKAPFVTHNPCAMHLLGTGHFTLQTNVRGMIPDSPAETGHTRPGTTTARRRELSPRRPRSWGSVKSRATSRQTLDKRLSEPNRWLDSDPQLVLSGT
ncbi:hypothetical protein J6590_087769 [Homalodisca vitripennis]|nr:hypothetical protein J6590_087769 [Homalodisca vitripennis]